MALPTLHRIAHTTTTPRTEARTGARRATGKVRASGFVLLFVFVVLLSLHVQEYGWQIAGSGVFVVLAGGACVLAVRPGWLVNSFISRGGRG